MPAKKTEQKTDEIIRELCVNCIKDQKASYKEKFEAADRLKALDAEQEKEPDAPPAFRGLSIAS